MRQRKMPDFGKLQETYPAKMNGTASKRLEQKEDTEAMQTETKLGRMARSAESERLYLEVMDKALAGLTAQEISASVGLSLHRTEYRLRVMRESGLIPCAVKRKVDRVKNIAGAFVERHNKHIGYMKDLPKLLTFDEMEWLMTITPEGSQAIETIASIIRDAYAEETEGDTR